MLGHVYVGGGDGREPTPRPGGLLGADYAVENGRYRFARIYRGENWNPRAARAADRSPASTSRRASSCWPSTARKLNGNDEVYRLFEAHAGKAVR